MSLEAQFVLNVAVDDLRRLSADARIENEKAQAERKAEAAEKIRRQTQKEDQRISNILASIPALCVEATKLGNACVVMQLEPGDCLADGVGCYQDLGRVAKTVFDACQAAGLRPNIEYWYEGRNDNGYQIIARW